MFLQPRLFKESQGPSGREESSLASKSILEDAVVVVVGISEAEGPPPPSSAGEVQVLCWVVVEEEAEGRVS